MSKPRFWSSSAYWHAAYFHLPNGEIACRRCGGSLMYTNPKYEGLEVRINSGPEMYCETCGERIGGKWSENREEECPS